MNRFQIQKYIIFSFIISLNIGLSFLNIYYENYWYIFIVLLSLASFMNTLYALSLFLNCIYSFFNRKKIVSEYDLNYKNLAIFVPCYNETIEELKLTFDSIYKQKKLNDDKILFVISDGNNETSENLKKIFNQNIAESYTLEKAYKTWDEQFEPLDIHIGIRDNMYFFIIIKHKNIGKRDSITLLRRLLFYYNNKTNSNPNYHTDILKYFSKDLINLFISKCNKILINILDDNNYYKDFEVVEIDKENRQIELQNIKNKRSDLTFEFLYGTDADTELDEKCIYNLINTLKTETKDVVACVGFVDLYVKDTMINYLKLYQYAEYYIAQLLRRNFQSTFTKKVNCLSGCNQLIRICEETCGDELLEKFNKKPKSTDNIFTHILYSASEDRNHVSFMFKLYPYVKTIQNINSVVYTKVPLQFKKLLAQRKRWNLGTFINDCMLVLNRNHNIIERTQSVINIIVNSLGLYIFIATIHFIINIVKNANMLMFYLSLLIIIPQLYNLSTPIIKYRKSINMTFYYYLSYIYYITFGPILNVFINIYTIFNIDNFKWIMN